MKIINKYPPNYEEIKKAFKLTRKDIVFTYGNILYNPSGIKISDNLLAHEEVHTKQQIDAKVWWERYLTDSKFRLQQELEAYQSQYKYQRVNHPHQWFPLLQQIAMDLSSSVYGNVITYKEAVDKITGKKDFRMESNFK